jgi:C-terminal processing protease CtpA/Prc
MASLAAVASDYRPVYAGAGLALRDRDGRVVVVAVAASGAAAQSGLPSTASLQTSVLHE